MSAPLSALEWAADGRLTRASLRCPDGGWVTIEPGRGEPGPWGASDLVTRDGRALTRFAALDWARVDRIPALAEPARLPPGAGTAILNLVARLAADQGARALRYDAPYPTEALFLALLESFRYAPVVPEPLAAFARDELTWQPAHHEVRIEAGGVWVQRRERVEKVVAAGRAYYRPEWQGVRRLAPRALRDTGDTVRASLVVLGHPVEDHFVLAPGGRLLEAPPAPPDPPATTVPLAPEVVAGLVATVVATSTAPLAPWLAALAREVAFAWGPVEADLVAVESGRVTLSHRLPRALAEQARGRSRADALAAALALLREAADLVGDPLRARAQQALAAEPPEVQAAALENPERPQIDARAIAAAADALLTAARG